MEFSAILAYAILIYVCSKSLIDIADDTVTRNKALHSYLPLIITAAILLLLF